MSLAHWITLCLMFLVAMNGTRVEAKVVDRTNYGMYFERVGKLQPSYDVWTHTFQLPIPKAVPPMSTDHLTCPFKHLSQITNPCVYFNQLNTMRNDSVQDFNSVINQVRDFSDNLEININKKRVTRAAFGFIGEWSEYLFGTATTHDIQVVSDHIKALEHRFTSQNQNLQKHDKHLSSFMSKVDQRMDNMKIIVADNAATLSNLANLVSNSNSADRYAYHLIALLFKDLHYGSKLQKQVDQFYQGMLDLMHHKISPLLLSFKTIQVALTEITTFLQAHPRFHLATLNHKQIYSSVPFTWVISDSSIYITMRFPLVVQDKMLDVYQIHTVPMPVNRTSTLTTQIQNLPPLVAFSRDSNHYALPTLANWHHSKFIHSATPLIETSKPNCVSALFAQHKQNIKDNCKFTVSNNKLKPDVSPIGNSKYLISAIPKIKVACEGHNTYHKDGCHFCIMVLPCGCDITADQFYLPPHITHCNGSSKEITISHPVNLALLQHFYSTSELSHIQADSTYPNPTQAKVPNIKLFNHNLTKLLANDNDINLDLGKMVNAMQNDDQIYNSLAEPILDKLPDFESNDSFSFHHELLIYIGFGLTALEGVLCVYLWYKQRCMAILLTAKIPQTTSQRLPTIYHLFSTTTQTTTTTTQTPIHVHTTSPIIYVILAFCCAYVIYRIISWLKQPKPHAKVLLEITNGNQCLLLTIMEVPCCPKFLHFQSDQSIGKIDLISHFLKPQITVDWQGLKITNLLNGKSFPLADQFSIAPWTAYRLRSLLNSPGHAYLVCVHEGYSFYTSICSMDCKVCSKQTTVTTDDV